MRIVAGRHRGRPLVAPPGLDIRPTSDRAREGLFNVLEHGRIAVDLDAVTGLEQIEEGVDDSPGTSSRRFSVLDAHEIQPREYPWKPREIFFLFSDEHGQQAVLVAVVEKGVLQIVADPRRTECVGRQ